MFPCQGCEVGVSLLPEGSRNPTCVCLAVRGALRSKFPLGQPISCLEPWDFIYLLHLGVRVVLRDVGLSCVCVSAAGPSSGGNSVSNVPACP